MKTAEELQEAFDVAQKKMDGALGNYTCPRCKAISVQIGLCNLCMPADTMPPRPATIQPSAAKSPEEYAKFVGGMATGVARQEKLAEQIFPPVEFYRHTSDLSAAAMDRRASDRANDKAPKPVPGKCPHCGYAGRGKVTFYAGEKFDCPGRGCGHIAVTAIPVNPNQTTPEMTESPWGKIERLEHDLEAEREARLKATHLLAAKEQELAEATKTRPEMLAKTNHDMGVRIVELERQLRDTQETAKKDDEFRVHIITDLADKLKAKDTELTEMAEAIDVATAEIDNAGKAITRLTTMVGDRDKLVQHLLITRKEDEAKIKDREMTMAVKDDRIRELEYVISSNFTQNTELRATICTLEGDNKFLEKRCDEANDYAKNASAKLAELEEKLEHGIKQEHDILEKAMHNAREEIRRLCVENERLTTRLHDRKIEVAEDELKCLETSKNDLEKARAACARLRQQAEGLQAQLNNAVEDRENVNRRFNQLMKARNAAAEERDRYASANVTLQEQRDSMKTTLRTVVFIAFCVLAGLVLAFFQIASTK